MNRRTVMMFVGLVTVGGFAALGVSKRASAQASVITTNEQVPIALTVFIPCVPETVTVTGTLHIVSHTTVNPDGSFHVVSHFNPQGVSGTGDVTGAQYRGTGVTQNTFNIAAGQTFTFANNFNFIGQGPGNNSTLHQNVHTTVNANGVVTSVVDNFSATCN
jgi:hypothetical protein